MLGGIGRLPINILAEQPHRGKDRLFPRVDFDFTSVRVQRLVFGTKWSLTVPTHSPSISNIHKKNLLIWRIWRLANLLPFLNLED